MLECMERDQRIDLRAFPPSLHPRALECLAARDALGFLCLAANDYRVEIAYRNSSALRSLGMLEEAFYWAVTGCRVNNSAVYNLIRWLVPQLNRPRLRSCGQHPPEAGPWLLYRGVAGRGAARRVRGYSWTLDFERARWFAERGGRTFGLADPAVFRAVVPDEHVLFFSNEREEEEFFVDFPSTLRVNRVANDYRAG